MMNLKGSKKKGGKYINPVPTSQPGLGKMPTIIQEYINDSSENAPKQPLGPFRTDSSVYQVPPQSGLRVTWLGHSSLLIEIDGRRILTDPVWSERVSVVQWLGPKRFFQPPLPLAELPPLDAILLSHDHYDHLDKDTIKYFAAGKVLFICSVGVGRYLEEWGVARKRITQIDWGDSTMIDHDCVVTATPARHFSGRGVFNRDETLWSAFAIRGNRHNIFFGADSGWFDGFKDIGDAYGPFDLTMLEIGAYGKYWPDIHMGPDNATNAHLALRGKLMLPIHWASFPLAPHPWYEPGDRVLQYAAQKQISLLMPAPGEPVEVGEAYVNEWWKAYK